MLVKVRVQEVWGLSVKKAKLDLNHASEEHKQELQKYFHSADPLTRLTYRQAFQLQINDLPLAEKKFNLKNAKFTLPPIFDEPLPIPEAETEDD
jgi:hypothetical protein